MIRSRAEDALGQGMPEEQAALARGFVLGEDDRIPPDTKTAFQRSGLAHHLAVSGENVVLLAVLAAPLLAALGIPLRARLIWLLALIALYVPLAGGGASIQRAGVMGAAAVVATLAGRPASRTYALLLAVAVTLGLNPRASSDVGWQLSFAAVAGIFVFGAPLRDLLLARLGEPHRSFDRRGAEADRRVSRARHQHDQGPPREREAQLHAAAPAESDSREPIDRRAHARTCA